MLWARGNANSQFQEHIPMGRWALCVFVFLLTALPASAQFANEHDRREAVRHYSDGQQLLAAEKFTLAADAFQRAIDSDRLLTLAHYGQGQAYMALRRFSSAIRAFTQCREAFRTLHALSASERGRVENRRQDEMRAVRDAGGQATAHTVPLELYLSSLERVRTGASLPFQTPAFVSLSLGSAYFRSGQLEDAEREWKAAVEADSRFGEGYNNLAALYAMTGRKAEAVAAVDAAEASGFRVHPQLKEDIRAITVPEYQSGRAGDVR